MQNPIPSPRPSSDPLYRSLPHRPALVGPACTVCDHPSCRRRRAQRLPRLGGHRSEYSREHAQAAQVQRQYRHLIIWWGENTQSFWVATPAGLEEAPDVDALLLKLWPHTDPPAFRLWTEKAADSRVPALT
ncbi:hypothetical protein [Nocardiopsis kunsanensis]|uniref:hypothetical protein n=1 Tax=Nocardiopsis kunsanensis TaxID=141693 RepID=UPI0005942E67|nr:hypothetical protein [Nocardiopsis kunsanensis]